MTELNAKQSPSKIFILALVGGILAISALLIVLINTTESGVEQESAVKSTPMLVDVKALQQADFTPIIRGLGRVQAAQDVVLTPLASGRVVSVSANTMPGSFVRQGDVLFQVEPADYQIALQQKKSELEQAKSALALELGRRDVAQREFNLIDEKPDGYNKNLVLREPQLMAAQALLNSAEAGVRQARLDLERATVRAPFNAQIISRDIHVGSQVDQSTTLARLLGVDEYWLIVSVPVSQIQHIALPEGEGTEEGGRVSIKNDKAWPENSEREGRVVRLIGALDQTTRLARIVVSVKDPLAEGKGSSPSLLVDSIVQAEIEAKVLKGVFRIKRDHLHENDTVWLSRNGKLHISTVTVELQDKQYAYISSGIEENDLLVTSSLTTVADGAPLRTVAQKP